MRVPRLSQIVCAVMVSALYGAAPRAADAQAVNAECSALTGSWALNADLSRGPDDERAGEDKAADGRGGPPPGGGTGGPPPGGGGGGGGGGFSMPGMGMGGGGMDRDRMKRVQRIMMAELAEVPRLAISCDGRQMTVTAGEERPEVLFLDAKRHLKLTGDGEIYTTTSWKDGRIVSERRYDEGIKATRTYSIETRQDGANRLVVVLKMDGMPRGGRGRDDGGRKRDGELRRVYDEHAPSGPATRY